MIELINRLIGWFKDEGHRGYLYRIFLALLAVLVVFGALTDDEVAKIILLIGAILGIGGNGLATANTEVGGRLRRKRDKQLDELETYGVHRYLEGRLGLDLVRTRELVYDFRFTDNDGRRCAFAGKKTVRLDDLVETMTVLPGKILGEGGEELGEALLRFDLRSDLLRFLRSFRLVR